MTLADYYFLAALTAKIALLQVLLLMAATLIGRRVACLLPYRLRPRAKLYLAPALGLGVLVLASSYIGYYVGFAVIPGAVAAATAAGAIVAWLTEARRIEAGLHGLTVGLVSFIAGSAILMCVWRYGGFDSANDAFTYLAHGNWLQTHAFREPIAPNDIKPYSTQVACYQRIGFRMGASYLLGWVQAMAGLRWSYVAYPVVGAAVATALGFAAVFAASLCCHIRRVHGLLLACLPGVSAGAVAFALIKGFLHQEVGSAFGLVFLAAGGAVIVEFMRPPKLRSPSGLWGSGLLLGGLFAAVVYSYGEISSFLAVGALVTLVVAIVIAPSRWLALLGLAGIAAITAILLINFEAFRAVRSIILESNAVVGWPVDWSTMEFGAHALGIHGGSGDPVEWITGGRALGVALMTGVAVLIVWSWRHPRRTIVLMALPLFCFAALCVLGFIYFRYQVPSPFPVGKGQSWSEFKLSEWVYPVCAFLILTSFASFIRNFRSGVATGALAAVIVAGLLLNYRAAEWRMAATISDLGTQRPIFATLLNIRANVIQRLQSGDAVYLDMGGRFLKMRQLLTYMLFDRDVLANWSDDGYIFGWLPPGRQNPSRKLASYIIAPIADMPAELREKLLWRIGSLGMFSTLDALVPLIVSANGGYDRETDGDRWWYWVKDQIVFELDEPGDAGAALGRRISFQYAQHGERDLSLEIIGESGRLDIALPQPADGKGLFQKTLPSSFGRIERIMIKGTGEPLRLATNDQRLVKFIIANLEVSYVRDP